MAIHPTSIIHNSAKIHESVEIGPFCYIGEDVEIDAGNNLLSHVVIKGPTHIGLNNKFYQFQLLVRALQIKNLREKKQPYLLATIIYLEKG